MTDKKSLPPLLRVLGPYPLTLYLCHPDNPSYSLLELAFRGSSCFRVYQVTIIKVYGNRVMAQGRDITQETEVLEDLGMTFVLFFMQSSEDDDKNLNLSVVICRVRTQVNPKRSCHF